MKRNKFKFLFSILSLTTFISIIPITIVACSPKKSTPSDNVENPPETTNPDVPNITPPNITPPKDDEISSSGGEHNGLNVSNYLEVVKTLNLSSSTNIVELNDNNLNNLLHQTYPELNVNIQNGSNQYNGELNLKLTNNQSREIINNNIVISGFNVNKYNNFTVVDAKINLEKWFNNFQPINNQNINNVNQDLDLLSRFEINIDDNAITINNTNYKDQFKIAPKFSIENNNLKINFNIEQGFKKYNNGEWVINSYYPLAIKNPLHEYDVQLPTLNQLFEFMMQQIKIIDSNAYNFYPSYFMGIGLHSIKIQQSQTAIFNYLNINNIIDKYKSTYFPNNQYNFLINSHSNFSANDSLGQLSFSIYVKNFDNTDIDNTSASHQLVLSGFKTLNINDNQYNNYVSVNNGSNLYNSLIKIFDNEIKQVKNDQHTIENVSKLGLNSFLTNYFGPIYYENMESNNIEDIINKINTNYSFSLFSNSISNFNTNISVDQLSLNNFNPNLGLYNLGSNSEDIIYLKSIDINLDPSKNSVSMNNRNNPEIRIFGNIAITFANNETINQNVVLVCEVLNDTNNLINEVYHNLNVHKLIYSTSFYDIKRRLTKTG